MAGYSNNYKPKVTNLVKLQMFLEKINNPQDIEGVWLIAQHADNDLEFQKMILTNGF